jgi:hypothetical protein
VAFGETPEFDHGAQDARRRAAGASDHGSNLKVRPWVDVGGRWKQLRFIA